MDPFYPTNLATGALPTTILPDYCFPPQQHQGASAHDLSSLAASMPVPPKQTAEPSGAMPAVQGPSAHQTATLYGAYLHDQACNNQAGMLAAAAAVGTFSREQQQVAFLHELHRRHLQQQAAVHHGGHSTLALEAAAGTAIALQLQQHSYTATGSFARICSNSGSHALAGTAAGIDDSLVLCDETIEMYSVGCSSSSSAFTSHSSMDMESCDDVENRDQQQQQHEAYQATTASKPGALQLLHRVATCRKGYAALNPARGTNSSNYAGTAAAGAEAAGSESVRARLLITEVSVYCSDMDNHKCWSNSPLALAQANELMSSMVLPEDVTYMPVSSDSWIFQAAAGYQFPSFVICLGSSYMQRMLAILPQLAEAAAAVPEFAGYCDYLPDESRPERHNNHQYLTGHDLAATKATLRSIQFTCLFLALKVADRIHALGLLRYILTKVSHNQRLVSLEDAADVEAQCLNALDWRLGPWFGEADLTGNDEELWAAAMGRQEYGTDADLWQ